MEMIAIIEECLGKKADYDFQGMQPGDVQKTFADIDHSKDKLGYFTYFKLNEGLNRFIKWYLEFVQQNHVPEGVPSHKVLLSDVAKLDRYFRNAWEWEN